MRLRSLSALALCVALAAPVAGKDMDGKSTSADAGKTLGHAPEREPAQDAQGRLAEVRRLVRAGKETEAYAGIAGLVDAPDFDSLSDLQRYEARSAAASLAWQADEHALALAHLQQATGYARARAHDWQSRAWLEVITGDRNAAANSLVELLRRDPGRAPDLDDQLLRGALQADHDAPSRRALLQTLFELDYAPRHTGDASSLWRRLAELQVDSGDTAAARATLARVTTPSSLVRVLADRRYDALIDRESPQFDLARAAHAEVADLRARAILAPDVLEIQVELVASLLTIGENEDALALVDEIIANEQGIVYRDGRDQMPWVYNHGSGALRRLGRTDEAVEYLRRGATLNEAGLPNVSQTLNLAQLHNDLGRHDEALAALESVVKNMSTFGRMVQANARLRVALDRGDRQAAGEVMALLRANREEAPGILLDSLVEAGELDDAAAELVAMLASREDRADALAMLQTHADEYPALPGERRYKENWDRLAARADVQAAVGKVGRILPPLPLH
jgi:tetratricopeptide (TPR) repeat protein